MTKEKVIASIERLDELSLYLEISRCKSSLNKLKTEALSTFKSETLITEEVIKEREYLKLLLSMLPKYGIDPTDNENLSDWIKACSTYINNLDVVNHIKFVQLRKEGKNLDLLLNKEEGKSSFLKVDDKKLVKEHKIG